MTPPPSWSHGTSQTPHAVLAAAVHFARCQLVLRSEGPAELLESELLVRWFHVPSECPQDTHLSHFRGPNPEPCLIYVNIAYNEGYTTSRNDKAKVLSTLHTAMNCCTMRSSVVELSILVTKRTLPGKVKERTCQRKGSWPLAMLNPNLPHISVAPCVQRFSLAHCFPTRCQIQRKRALCVPIWKLSM